MNNEKTWYDEAKQDFVKNISDSYTLNLAMSILEDRKSLLNENLKDQNNWNELKKGLEEKLKEPIMYNLLYDGKRKAYKETLDKMQELENRKV